MKSYLLISDSDETAERLATALGSEAGQLERWSLAEVAADGGALITTPIRGRRPETVILGPDTLEQGTFALAAQIDASWPGVALLLVSGADAATLRAAMRAGIRDLLDPAESAEDWAATIATAHEAARAHQSASEEQAPEASAGPSSQVVVVLSSKGGSGKTTVATNLAVGLAAQAPTVIVDIDLEFGDVANALRLTPDRWLQDVVFGPARNDTMVLKSFVTEHESGLFAICAPERPEDAGGITGEHVAHLVQQLAQEYRHVVIDTPPGLAEHTLAALELASDGVLVCGLDVPSIRGLRKELDILGELGLRPRREHLVLNNVDPRGGLSVADAEKALGRDVDVVIPAHRSLRLATNEGVPLLRSTRRGRIAKALLGLVERVRAGAGGAS
ncbi:P-loop NTPase [Salinibacterium sp. SYSU T00001]|uniref:AAA family ATPase n=1 Tax=Homoserinimonas sedimenticola TaxID=2986805 RepID=UPI002235980A|nr:P-loop NTPase [Salinibacterium sedimenticola]MCW4385429.1 P-loop NTPase [Salinibacterium sedimenticola]